MRALQVLFSATLISAAICGSAFADSGCEAVLTAKESGLLKMIRENRELRIRASDFDYRVLSKNIEGRPVSLILVADSEIKRPAGAGAKTDLINAFPYSLGTPAFSELSPRQIEGVEYSRRHRGEYIYDGRRVYGGLISLAIPPEVTGHRYQLRDRISRWTGRAIAASIPIALGGIIFSSPVVRQIGGGLFLISYIAWRFVLNPQYGVANQTRRFRYDAAIMSAIEKEFQEQSHVSKAIAFVDARRFRSIVAQFQREGWSRQDL